jgi:hypothetical protein
MKPIIIQLNNEFDIDFLSDHISHRPLHDYPIPVLFSEKSFLKFKRFLSNYCLAKIDLYTFNDSVLIKIFIHGFELHAIQAFIPEDEIWVY